MTQSNETEQKKRGTNGTKLTAAQWLEIEVHYRAGIRTVTEIAAEYGIKAPSISQMAKRRKWSRDLSGKAKLLAQEKINEELTRNTLEVATVEAVADQIAQIDGTHKAEIARLRAMVQNLLDELESMTSMEGDANLQELGDIVLEGCPMKLKSAYRKVINLPHKIGMVKTVSETLKSLVQLERELFNIGNEGDKVEDALANVLNSIATRNNSALVPMPLDVDYVERTNMKDIN